MKKVIRFIRNNILGFTIGVVVCSATVVIAIDAITSSIVEYDTSNSRSNYNTVQGAIDDLYNKVPGSAGLTLIANQVPGLSSDCLPTGNAECLYRFQGEFANNYICFGTRDKDTCIGDEDDPDRYDKYMYRIMGITTDGKMKLIKKEAFNTAYQWNNASPSGGVTWPNSQLYKRLNGLDEPGTNYFLTNTTYVPSGWDDRIVKMPWHYAIVSSDPGSASGWAASELAGTAVSAKIGIMYLHDLYYASQSEIVDANSWINLSKSDSGAPEMNEWTITRNTASKVYYYHDTSIRASTNPLSSDSVRPVFYLNAYQVIGSGTGTLSDPYILDREYNITNNSDLISVRNTAPAGTIIQLNANTPGLYVGSFKLNGATMIGNTFTMPTNDVTISDIVIYNINYIDDYIFQPSSAIPGSTVTITNSLYTASSFKLNGVLIEGDSFVMPAEDVTITDIVKTPLVITVETETHNPFPKIYNTTTYFENTFEGANSITVELTYQTRNTSTTYSYVRLFSSPDVIYGTYANGTRTTTTFTIPGNYIKIDWYANPGYSSNSYFNYYGFKAVITPNE